GALGLRCSPVGELSAKPTEGGYGASAEALGTPSTASRSPSPYGGGSWPYSAGRTLSERLLISLSNSDQTPASPCHWPRVAALEYSVERASKKLACSTPDSIDCSQGSGFS